MPTPDSMLADLIAILPEFAAQWNSDDNLFCDDSGNYSYYGLFIEFSHYFHDHFSAISEPQLRTICAYIEPFVRDDNVHEDIHNAICTCFLENLSGKPFTTELPKYLGRKSLKFYRAWHDL